jgi:transcriptional regulator with XRE-family HTH domain
MFLTWRIITLYFVTMQAFSVFPDSSPYALHMQQVGRPPKFERSPFGEKLLVARQQAGLSQIQVAERLGITQQTYAGWERRTTALKPEYIAQLSSLLNVSVDYLIGKENGGTKKGGPVGKARRVFEEVSRLPRHKQQRILGIVEDLLAAHRVQS